MKIWVFEKTAEVVEFEGGILSRMESANVVKNLLKEFATVSGSVLGSHQ